MCDESSSVLIGNPADTDFVNEVDHPENAEDEYRIDGMEDIGRVRFDLLNGDEVYKYHFADNGTGYEFYNTYAMVSGFSVRKSKIGRNAGGVVVRHNFLCSSEGYRQVGTIENRRREPKAITRHGCQAAMRIRLNAEFI